MAIFQDLAVMSYICHVQKYGLLKIQKKCRSTEKTVSKNIKLVKSCGQNKFDTKIMALSFVF
jgi:hypothetical protein